MALHPPVDFRLQRLASDLREGSIPACPDTVAASLAVQVGVRDLPVTLWGATTSSNRVVLNQKLSPQRRRFALAHELGHVLFRRGRCPWVGADREEHSADEFASELLTPSSYVATCGDSIRLAEILDVEEWVAELARIRCQQRPSPQRLCDGTVLCIYCGARARATATWCDCAELRAGYGHSDSREPKLGLLGLSP